MVVYNDAAGLQSFGGEPDSRLATQHGIEARTQRGKKQRQGSSHGLAGYQLSDANSNDFSADGVSGWDRAAGEICPLLLVAAGGESFDAATLWGHDPAHRVAAFARIVKSTTVARKQGGGRKGDGEVSREPR